MAKLESMFLERARQPVANTEGPALLAPQPDSSLRDRLHRLEAELKFLTEESDRQDLSARLARAVDAVVPVGATVVVASDDDNVKLELGGRVVLRFPQAESGHFLKHSDRDSDTLIRHLEIARARGAEYFVLPSTAYWWLDQYRKFGRHLVRRYHQVQPNEEDCLIVDLRSEQQRSRLLTFLGGRFLSR